MGVIVPIALIAWVIFGSPLNDIADWFWPDDPAPWEQVDAFYYPDKDNLTVSIDSRNVESVEGCRDWVRASAGALNDPGLNRGDYECGVGYIRSEGTLRVYRLTMR